jgi:excisionase family DNA binding protein
VTTASNPLPLAAAAARLRGPSPSRQPSRPGPAKGHQPRQKAQDSPIPLSRQPRTPDRESNVLPRLLGIDQAAAYLGLSTWTLRDMVTGGELRPVRLLAAGREVRRLLFDRVDLDRMIATSQQA